MSTTIFPPISNNPDVPIGTYSQHHVHSSSRKESERQPHEGLPDLDYALLLPGHMPEWLMMHILDQFEGRPEKPLPKEVCDFTRRMS